jgi:hypothetical protein
MGQGIVRWGGVAAVVLAVLFLVRLLGEAVSGADVYGDDAEDFLIDLDDGRVGAFVATYAMLLSPLAMGFFAAAMVYALSEEDRPWALAGAALLGGGSLVILAAAATYGTLIPLAGDFVDAPEPLNEAIAADGDWIATTFATLSVGGFALLGAGTILVGRLMLGARLFPRWLAWVTMAVGVITFVYFTLGPVVNVVYPLWLLVVAYLIWDRTRPASRRTVIGEPPAR